MRKGQEVRKAQIIYRRECAQRFQPRPTKGARARERARERRRGKATPAAKRRAYLEMGPEGRAFLRMIERRRESREDLGPFVTDLFNLAHRDDLSGVGRRRAMRNLLDRYLDRRDAEASLGFRYRLEDVK